MKNIFLSIIFFGVAFLIFLYHDQADAIGLQLSLTHKRVMLDAPLDNQMPELPRGCEVTTLDMMLQYAGVKVDKITLAKQIKKDNTPYQEISGIIYFGNPHNGFVGDMYSRKNPGYGVYHEPVKELAEQYLPGRVRDLTDSSFDTVLQYLDKGRPVWVINNNMFDAIPLEKWQTWNTPQGKMSITYEEHSVLVTGYDEKNIYFNDPLSDVKNEKVPIKNFIRGWEQMGRQAISYE